MQVQISGQNIEITDALRSHVNTKLDRLTRHFDNLISLNVVLSVDKLEHLADGTITGSANFRAHAAATHEDMYSSIDLMIDKLVTQIRKHKEKLTDRHRREARVAASSR